MRTMLIRPMILLGFVLSTLLSPSMLTVNAASTANIMILTTENGQPATDACYVLMGFSNTGCDVDKDGAVYFNDIPAGTYVLHQTADLGPGRYVEDTLITVTAADSGVWEFFDTYIINEPSQPAAQQQEATDISLITRDPKTGGLLTGMCYELLGYSNVGCDENGDGQVDFADIPYGAYTVHQTKTPAGYPTINDYTIEVEPTDYPTGFVVRQAANQNAPNTRNVSIVLIDVRTNTRLPLNACARIVNASNAGCDDDLQDGQIDFLDVPAGRHEIIFTELPQGYVVTNEYALVVQIDAKQDPANVFVYIHLIQQP